MKLSRLLVAAVSGLTLGLLLGALASALQGPQPISFFDQSIHDVH